MLFLLTLNKHSISLPYAGGQRPVPNFEMGGDQKKNECIGELKAFRVKKDSKIAYGFQGSISNVGIGLFQRLINCLVLLHFGSVKSLESNIITWKTKTRL